MDLLQGLKSNPVKVFLLCSNSGTIDELNNITKSLLDPIARDHSVLHEIYTEGLDSNQVWGQAQIILLNVGETYLFSAIPRLKEIYSVETVESDDEEDSEEDEVSGNEESDDEEDNVVKIKEMGEEEVSANRGQPEEDFRLLDEDKGDPGLLHNEELLEAESEGIKIPSDDEIEAPAKDEFGLNDGFFDIDQFNKQIVALEDEDGNDDEEQVDFFADMDDGGEEDEEQNMDCYDEFFDKPGFQKSVISIGAVVASDPDDEHKVGAVLEEREYEQAVDSAMLDLVAEDGEVNLQSAKNLSSFEQQQQKLQAEIRELEAELIAEKKWTMKGEVKSKDRPAESLLNDDEAPNLEFDRTSKPVPVITDEVTETIEDLIKRRIRNSEFNDLPRRLITDVGKFTQKKKTEVSDQKSTKSLADIYEDEYHGVKPDDKVSDEVNAAHEVITDLFTKLNYKLDSLFLAHYIPKPGEFKSIEIKVSDAPASISMEDAQPLHISDDLKLAPQETYKPGDDKPKADSARGTSHVQLKCGLSYSKDELDRDAKQRLRRAKKRAKSKHFNRLKEAREQRENQAQRIDNEGDRKRQKGGDVVDTLSRAKNLTVIDKKGQLRDVHGKLKSSTGAQSSNNFRL